VKELDFDLKDHILDRGFDSFHMWREIPSSHNAIVRWAVRTLNSHSRRRPEVFCIVLWFNLHGGLERA